MPARGTVHERLVIIQSDESLVPTEVADGGGTRRCTRCCHHRLRPPIGSRVFAWIFSANLHPASCKSDHHLQTSSPTKLNPIGRQPPRSSSHQPWWIGVRRVCTTRGRTATRNRHNLGTKSLYQAIMGVVWKPISSPPPYLGRPELCRRSGANPERIARDGKLTGWGHSLYKFAEFIYFSFQT